MMEYRMNPFRRIGALALPLAWIALSCSGPSGWIGTIDWDPQTVLSMEDPAGAEDTGALVVADEGSMEIFSGGTLGFSVFDRHRVVRIYNARGHRYANVIIPYGSGSTVSDIQARTMNADGRISLLQAEDVFDVSLYPNFVFFSDQRAKIFTLPGVEDGSIIEYRYRVHVQNRTFWHSWSFQDDVPVLKSRFTLVKPGEWQLRYRTYGIDVEPSVIGAPAGFKSKHVWEATNVSPFQPEFGMPPPQELTGRLALAPVGYSSWTDVSRWYSSIATPRMDAGPLVRALSDSLTAGVADPRDRLRVLYTWVRDHIRYIAVEVGVGGYEPHDAEVVLSKRYGDCKDMVILLCSLSRESGITTLPVLVSTLENGRPDTSLPSPLQFNHLIAYAPEIGADGTWMDPTEKGCTFGRIPWYDQGLPVIVAGEKGTDATRTTPREDDSANGISMRWRIRLSFDSPGTVEGTSTLSGAVALDLRHEMRRASERDQRAWLENFLSKRVPVAVLDTFSITGLSPESDSIVVSYRFHSSALAMRSDSSFSFRPGQCVGTLLADYFRAPSRKHPIRFRFGSRADLDADILLPAGWKPALGMINGSFSSPFGSWHATAMQQESSLHLKIGYFLRGEDIPPHKYPSFQSFLDSIRVMDSQDLVLRKL